MYIRGVSLDMKKLSENVGLILVEKTEKLRYLLS